MVCISKMLPLCLSYLGMALLCSFLEHSSFLRSQNQGHAAVLFSMGLGSMLITEAMGRGQETGEWFSSEGRHLKRTLSGMSFQVGGEVQCRVFHGKLGGMDSKGLGK